jgi:hypothetical protein
VPAANHIHIWHDGHGAKWRKSIEVAEIRGELALLAYGPRASCAIAHVIATYLDLDEATYILSRLVRHRWPRTRHARVTRCAKKDAARPLLEAAPCS